MIKFQICIIFEGEEISRWKGIKSIGMICKTIKQAGKKVTERRYYISSLPSDVELFARTVREHWSVESMHWYLDVTFKEDANTTLDKTAAQNLNIINKWCWEENVFEKETLLYQYECQKVFGTDIKSVELDNEA